jgi:hypothetical protein
MADAKKAAAKTSSKKGLDIVGALKQKLGPLPAWAWLGIAAVGVFLWRRHQGASATQGAGTTLGTDTSSGGADTGAGTATGGGSGGGGDSPGTTSPVDDNGLGPTGRYGGGPAAPPPTTTSGGGTASSPATGPGAAAQAQAAATKKVAQTPVAATNPNFAAAERAKTAAAKQAGVPVAFGGVSSVSHLKNGATLTTFASGRKVEQVKGKSAYVVKK